MVLSTGFSRVLADRRFEDYRSMKQHFQHRHCVEFVISGSGTTAGAEFQFTSDTIDYIAAEGQAYIRCELDDANQHSKYVYIEYQDDTGQILTAVTADLDAADSAVELAIGSTDFYRLRQMWSEVEAATGGTKAIVLTDANWGGADDTFGFIEDNESAFAAQRYFVPLGTQCKAYLGRVIAKGPQIAAAAAAVDAIILTITYTPKVIDGAEDQVKADKQVVLTFNKELDWQPCIELEPATEVIFSWSHTTTGQAVWFEADFLEVYAKV